MKLRTLLLFGAPGCGKGTQGRILGRIPGYFHCSCGDVFRSLKTKSDLGKMFKEYSGRGELVPDEPTVELWRQFIDNARQTHLYDPAHDTLLLDGIPRNVRQAELLDNSVDVRAILHLSCPNPDILVERLQRRALHENRLDDAKAEVIRHRLDTYVHESKPVLAYYGESLLHDVDATQTPIGVLQDVLKIVANL